MTRLYSSERPYRVAPQGHVSTLDLMCDLYRLLLRDEERTLSFTVRRSRRWLADTIQATDAQLRILLGRPLFVDPLYGSIEALDAVEYELMSAGLLESWSSGRDELHLGHVKPLTFDDTALQAALDTVRGAWLASYRANP